MRQERGASYQRHPHLHHPGGRSLPAHKIPYIDRRPAAAYPQAHQQRFTLSYANPSYYTMAAQASAGDAATQGLQHDRDSHRPHTPVLTSQPQLYHPQSGHSFPSQSFFYDEYFNYHAEEATLFNPSQDVPAQDAVPRSKETLALPCAPTCLPVIANNITASQTAASGADVPIMPLVLTNVDTKMFEPVEREHWQRASLDFSVGNDNDAFAMSPSSTDDTSLGPFTPHDISGFPEATLRRISHDLSSSFDSSGTDMFEEHGPDMKFSSFSDVGSTMGARIGSQATHYAGLPFPGGDSFGELRAPSLNDLPLNEGSFRDIDGLPPIFPAITPVPEEHDGSVTSRTAPKTKRRRSSEKERESALRETRDQFLLDRREEGFTYKDIKAMGNFFEAESTLRGRVRVLTKDRSERVRKPVWTEGDVSATFLLNIADDTDCDLTDSTPPPWSRQRQEAPYGRSVQP